MEITFIETPNLEKLKEICNSPYLYKESVNSYIAYYQQALITGNIEITYKQNLYNRTPYGRFYPKHESKYVACATYQWSCARADIFSDTETDIDIVNCHPTLLNNLCNEYGVNNHYLSMYVNDRDKFFDSLNVSNSDLNIYNKNQS